MKYTDMHTHIEGTVSARTIVKLILKYQKERPIPEYFSDYQKEIISEIYKKIDSGESEQELTDYMISKLQLEEPTEDLMEFIIRLPTKFLTQFVRSKEDLSMVLQETLDQYDESFEKVEFIFCPVALENEWLSDDNIVSTFSEFWQNHPNKQKFEFILSLRKMMPDMEVEYTERVVNNYSQYFDKGIPKLDICGNEAAIDYTELTEQLDILSKSNQELTLHIGETSEKDLAFIMDKYPNIKQFNHGIQGALNPELLKKLKENDIFLTVCPLSNIYTGVLDEESLLKAISNLKDKGVRYSVCSDDATIINGDVAASHKYLEKKDGSLIS